jgi:hypothetical protein
MRKFSRTLGLALAAGVVTSRIWIPLSAIQDISFLASNAAGLLALFLLYRSVTHLSLPGHVIKADSTSRTGQSGGQDTNIVGPVARAES